MSDEQWIGIVGWDKFQHPDITRSVVAPWIKNYTRLMSDDNYLQLTEHCGLLLHRLWLTYASARCHLLLNTASLSRHLHLRVMTRDLEALRDAGFIEFLQAPPSASNSRAGGEVEREYLKESFKETRTEAPSQKPAWRPTEPTRTNVQARDPVAAITTMIQNGVIRDQVDLDAELAGYRLDTELTAELRTLLELQSVSNLLESERT